jgi:hypothetical protein
MFLPSLLAAGAVCELTQQAAKLLAVQVESKVIYNGFDVAGGQSVLRLPLVARS